MKEQPEQRLGVNARMDQSIASWRKRLKKGKGPRELLIDSDLIDGRHARKGGLWEVMREKFSEL
jgi:hypothetical protein